MFSWATIVTIVILLISILSVHISKNESTMTLLYKAYWNRKEYKEMMNDIVTKLHSKDLSLQGKNIIVTGSNRGLGTGIAAHMLMGRPKNLILPVRQIPTNITHAKQTIVNNAYRYYKEQQKITISKEDVSDITKNTNIIFVPMDLASLDSIDSAVQTISRSSSLDIKKIDILINNAGLIPVRDITTKEGFELAFGVNFLGTAAFTKQLRKAKLLSSGATIVMISSEEHRLVGEPIILSSSSSVKKFGTVPKHSLSTVMDRYGYSKLALLTWTYELQRRWKDIHIYSICPGPVASNIARDAPWILKDIVQIMMKILFPSPMEAALPVIRLALNYNIPSKEDINDDDVLHFHMGKPRKGGKESSYVQNGNWIWEQTENLFKQRRPPAKLSSL